MYVVDDDESVRDSLEVLLASSNYAVRSFESGRDFLNQAPSLAPGCAILDVRMPEVDGIALLHRLSELNVKIPVIVMTGYGDVSIAVSAMKAGAVDFVEKPIAWEQILASIQVALNHYEQPLAIERARAAIGARLQLLSQREAEVLEGIVVGLPNKAIARRLSISPRTVEVHRARVMDKMQAQSLSELVRLALAGGLEPPK